VIYSGFAFSRHPYLVTFNRHPFLVTGGWT